MDNVFGVRNLKKAGGAAVQPYLRPMMITRTNLHRKETAFELAVSVSRRTPSWTTPTRSSDAQDYPKLQRREARQWQQRERKGERASWLCEESATVVGTQVVLKRKDKRCLYDEAECDIYY